MREQLAQARRRLGMSQGQVAELLGVGRATVCHWERGTQVPYPVHAQKLRELYGASLTELGLEEESSLISRREAMRSMFGSAIAVAQFSDVEAVLSWASLGVPALWNLHYRGENEHIGSLLPMYLAALKQASAQPTPYQRQALAYYSQVLQLNYEVSVDREDFQAALFSATQAALAAEAADNRMFQVSALIRLADCHFHQKQPTYAIQTCQRASLYLKDATPLLAGRMYVSLAEASGMAQDRARAEHAIEKAYELFPSDPGSDPAYSFTHFSLYGREVFGRGQTYLFLGQPEKASEAFEFAANHLALYDEPLTRLDLLYYQAQASVQLGDGEQSTLLLAEAGELARKLSSQLYLQKLRVVYTSALNKFAGSQSLKSIAEVMNG